MKLGFVLEHAERHGASGDPATFTFNITAGEIDHAHGAVGGVVTRGRSGDMVAAAEDVLAMTAIADAVVDNEADDDGPGIMHTVVDIFASLANLAAEASHAIPREAAIGAPVAAAAGGTGLEDVAQRAAGHTSRGGEGRQRTGLLQKMDGFGDGTVTFSAMSLSGDDLGVLLRGGAGQIDFRENLFREIAGVNGERGKGDNQETGKKFHNFCKAGLVPWSHGSCY
jgi:hypothetical protein